MDYINISVRVPSGLKVDVVVEPGSSVESVLLLAGYDISKITKIYVGSWPLDKFDECWESMVLDISDEPIPANPCLGVPPQEMARGAEDETVYDFPCMSTPFDLDQDFLDLLDDADGADEETVVLPDDDSMTVAICNVHSGEYEGYLGSYTKPLVYNGLLSEEAISCVVDDVVESIGIEVESVLLTMVDRKRGMVARFATEDRGFSVEFFSCVY